MLLPDAGNMEAVCQGFALPQVDSSCPLNVVRPRSCPIYPSSS